MILFKTVIQIGVRAMLDMFAELRSDRPRIGIVTISGDPVRHDASDRLGRAKECLSRGEIAMFTQHHIDEGAISIDRTIEIPLYPCKEGGL